MEWPAKFRLNQNCWARNCQQAPSSSVKWSNLPALRHNCSLWVGLLHWYWSAPGPKLVEVPLDLIVAPTKHLSGSLRQSRSVLGVSGRSRGILLFYLAQFLWRTWILLGALILSPFPCWRGTPDSELSPDSLVPSFAPLCCLCSPAAFLGPQCGFSDHQPAGSMFTSPSFPVHECGIHELFLVCHLGLKHTVTVFQWTLSTKSGGMPDLDHGSYLLTPAVDGTFYCLFWVMIKLIYFSLSFLSSTTISWQHYLS